jgi:hypothetical protein
MRQLEACNHLLRKNFKAAQFVFQNYDRGKPDSFSRSLYSQVFTRHSGLSDGQINAAERIQKQNEEREEKEVKKIKIDMSGVYKLRRIYEKRREETGKGPEKVGFLLGDLKFQIFDHAGVEPEKYDSYFIKRMSNSVWQGYVDKVTGEFHAFRRCDITEEEEQMIKEFNGDPIETMKRVGKRTGKCSICSRKLTNETSIDLGIGPICLGYFGG